MEVYSLDWFLGAIALGSKKGGNVDIDQVEDLDNDDEEYNITEEDVEDVGNHHFG